MAKATRYTIGAYILVLFWTITGVVGDNLSVLAPSTIDAPIDEQAPPTFTVTSTIQVLWKDGSAKNASINISSSSPSYNESVLGWCTHLRATVHNSSSPGGTNCLAQLTKPETDGAKVDAMGQILIKANTSSVPPIQVKLDWNTIRADHEYMLAARLVGLTNANVPPQEVVAMFIYGVSAGTCPPGTVRKNQQNQPPLTFHEPNATLQDMYLEVCPTGTNCAVVPGTLQQKFLHPAFSPTELNYSALVPHSSSTAVLVLRSIRNGDTVLFNATQCKNLETQNQTVLQNKQEIRYNITAQLGTVCNLTIVVYRQQPSAEPEVEAATDTVVTQASSADQARSKASPVPKRHSQPPHKFTIMLVQLLDPLEVPLDTLNVTNTTHTLVLCGNYTPRALTKEVVMKADPFSNRCDEGSCFSVYADQVPTRPMVLHASNHLQAFISALPSSKAASKGNASYENMIITIKSEKSNAYSLINYRLLIIHNSSDPNTNTEKLSCSTMTSASSDIRPALPAIVDNSTSQDQTGLKKWLFASRDRDYPMHPAQGKSCLVCPSGTHSASANANACQYCPPGYFSNLSQWPAPLLSHCKPCKPGSFSSWGAQACRPCWAGTYSPGNTSTACQMCPAGKSTRGDGAASCDTNITTGLDSYDNILLRFVVELTGTFNLNQLPFATGINSTGPLILSYLMRRDVAAWLNVSTDDVDASLPVAAARHLIKMDVSAKLQDESEAARSSKQLTMDEVVAGLDKGLSTGETVKYSGALQVNVRLLSKTEMHRKKRKQMQQLHAILWPVLLGMAALVGTTWWLCRRYLRRRNRKMSLQIQDTTGFFRWLNRDSIGHSSLSAGESAPLDMEMPDLAVNNSTTPTPGGQRHRKQFLTNYSSDESP